MHRLRCTRAHASVLLLALSLAGCGTTVPLAGGATTSGLGSDGLGSGAVSSTAGPGSATGTTSDSTSTGSAPVGGASSTGAAGSGAAGTSVSGGPTGGPAGTATTGAVTGGPVDRSPVKVAVFYLNGGNAAISSAFPGSSVSFGDGKREAQTVIADANAKGGIHGRKLVATYVGVEVQDANDAGLQKACQGVVQDVHPIAIFAMFNLAEGLSTCAKKAGVLIIDVALGAGDDKLYADARDIAFSPTQISRDREQRLVLGLAHEAGKLPAGSPVGILVQDDDPLYTRVAKNTIEPLLTSWGVPFLEHHISTGADTSGISSAIIKFASSDVKTVVFSLGNGGIPEALFMQAAEQQQYRPAYLMGDSTGTNFVGGAAPAEQIKKISGAGTYPLANVGADQYPSSPGEKTCLALLNKEIGGYTDRSSSLTGTLYCEIVQSFVFVANAVAGPLTPASWARAYHALGSRYTAVTTFGTTFLPGRQDGANQYRTLAYSAACACITYTSPARPIPAA